MVKAIGMNRSECYLAFGKLEQRGCVEVWGRSKKDDRPNGQIRLIVEEDEKSSCSPEQSRDGWDDSDRTPRNRPAVPPYRDGRDDGTICGPGLAGKGNGRETGDFSPSPDTDYDELLEASGFDPGRASPMEMA